MVTPQQLAFANRNEWRAWLEVNHAITNEVWLVHYKKHTGKIGVSYEEAVEEALCFGWIDGLLRSIDAEQYALRFSPRKQGSVWSESNKRRVRKLIKQGRMTEAGLAKVKEAKVNGQWHAAKLREDTTVIPDDLTQALQADPPARRTFDRLAPSHRRQYLYWIASAKTDQTRQRRIQETVRRVGENKNTAYREDEGSSVTMTIGLFADKEFQPTETAVLEALGAKRPLWEELTHFIADNYPIPGEWSFGGKNYGWNLGYRKSDKTLITLYPQDRYFVAQIVLGKEQVEQALTLKLGKNVGTVLAETPQLHDGRWLFIKVKTKRDVADIKQLLQIKRRPRPQK
jgi:uncharacterized protein YdeI (YjbR/CyaY-like superfamily)